MLAIYAKYCERGGLPVIRGDDMARGADAARGGGDDAFRDTDVSKYAAILTDIYKLASYSYYIWDMRVNGKLNDLLTLLMESSWHQGNSTNASKKMDFSIVKSLLDEHYKEKLSLESVAANLFIDKHYLARLFKEQYVMTLVTYLQRVRITHV